MNRYRVWLSNNMSHTVKAETARQARLQVWNATKDGYTYGWDRKDFLDNATTEKTG